jgi:quinol monooxygenase YgiN
VQWLDLTTALLIGTAVMLLSALSLHRWRLYGMEGIDPTLSDHWPTPPLVFVPGPSDGPVLVSVVYRVAPDDSAEFIEAMDNVARSRRRTGALTWGLYQDGNEPGRFIENYLVGSWAEHLAQHHHRLTTTDRGFEDKARALLLPGTSAEVTHAFDASVVGPPGS